MENFEEINKLKEKNKLLKRENEIITGMHNSSRNRFNKLYNTLQEIKSIAKDNLIGCFANKCDLASEILQIITKAEEE